MSIIKNDVLMIDSMGSLARYAGWVRAYVYNENNIILAKFVGKTREAISESFSSSEFGCEGNELIFMVVPGKASFLRGDDYEILYLD